ncbi:hypothetical protein K438DRAFT_1818442 [Mycena galopus ATCC 62051]|nr:hypothetical protein K438DRAFT_1818442 [Mycena galopus ATCC 62051]
MDRFVTKDKENRKVQREESDLQCVFRRKEGVGVVDTNTTTVDGPRRKSKNRRIVTSPAEQPKSNMVPFQASHELPRPPLQVPSAQPPHKTTLVSEARSPSDPLKPDVARPKFQGDAPHPPQSGSTLTLKSAMFEIRRFSCRRRKRAPSRPKIHK